MSFPSSGEGSTRLLIYDGDCGFCTKTARWVAAGSAVKVVPWQEIEDLDSYGLGLDDVSSSAWFIDDSGTYGADQAIARSLLAMKFPWAPLGILISHAPLRWFGPPIYRILARHRHRLPGGTSACKVKLQ